MINLKIGLKRVLRKSVDALEDGGYFVLEPQDWDSYGTAVKKNRNLRAAKEALAVRPVDFPKLLEELGMVMVGSMEERKRPLMVWRKKGASV